VKSVQFCEGGNQILVGTEKALKYQAAIHIIELPKEVLEKTSLYTRKKKISNLIKKKKLKSNFLLKF
jgi:hypothetical protein